MIRIAIFLLVILSTIPTHGHPREESKLVILNQQIEEHPEQQDLYIKRGAVFSHLGKYKQALADFTFAKTLGNSNLVMFELGVMQYQQQQFSKSMLSFDSYLKLFPNHVPSLEYKARIYRDLGDYSAALEGFSNFLKLNPYNNPGHYLRVAELIIQMDLGINAALQIIDQGINNLGKIPQLQNFAIELELKQKQFDRAIERHKTLAPAEHPKWQLRMAELLMAAGSKEQAKTYITSAKHKLNSSKKTPANLQLVMQSDLLESELDN